MAKTWANLAPFVMGDIHRIRHDWNPTILAMALIDLVVANISCCNRRGSIIFFSARGLSNLHQTKNFSFLGFQNDLIFMKTANNKFAVLFLDKKVREIHDFRFLKEEYNL